MSTKHPRLKIFHWHVFVPLYAAVLVLLMAATYFLALNFPVHTDAAFTLDREATQSVETAITSQFNGLLLAMLVAVVVIVSFIIIGVIFKRLEKIRATAEALASGHYVARTGMEPIDEIGKLGQALDVYANYVQIRHDALRENLRRERHENERLTAVLEALPDAVIVQDLTGQVVTLNHRARKILNVKHSRPTFPYFEVLDHVLDDRLGDKHDPTDPSYVAIEEQIYSVQVVPVTGAAGEQIATALVLRDVTDAMQLEEARHAVIQRMEYEVRQPLAGLGHPESATSAKAFTSDIRQHAHALQNMIRDLHDLTDSALYRQVDEEQRAISVDTLIWSVANDWRQVAHAQNLEFHVVVEKQGLCILGQEHRLRWAIGNVIDNAIKYTPPGGGVSLEVHDDESGKHACIWVRDNGVGIAPDEQAQVFSRFYRGHPVTKEGRAVRVPGSGQGLTIADQIIQAHGGSLIIKSKQWMGTGVYLQLPLTASVSLEMPLMLHDLEGETVRMSAHQKL